MLLLQGLTAYMLTLHSFLVCQLFCFKCVNRHWEVLQTIKSNSSDLSLAIFIPWSFDFCLTKREYISKQKTPTLVNKKHIFVNNLY